MITDTSQYGGFTGKIENAYTIVGQTRQRVYTGERAVLVLQTAAGNAQVSFDINNIVYYSDANGRLVYDFTDEIRSVSTFDIDIYLGGSNPQDGLTFELKPHEGIAPEHLLLPAYSAFAGTNNKGVQIMPPCTIYQHEVLSKYYSLAIELYGAAEAQIWSSVWYFDYQNDFAMTPTNNRILPPIRYYNGEYDWCGRLECAALNFAQDTILLNECDNACVIRWKSAMGNYKQAIWKVKKIRHKAAEIALLPIGDGYKQMRGDRVSFVAYIECLDAYSAAYYADIITSGDVHCAMNGGEDLSDYATSVRVETSDFTQADGDAGELQTLEITINFKQYDSL